MKKSTSGFTIIELMTVIIVLGILVAVVVVGYNGVQGRSRDAIRRSDISNITKALEQYYDDNGTYPAATYRSDNINWSTFSTALNGGPGGPVIDDLPKDPKNSGDPTLATGYGYSYYYYTAAACGQASGQWYMLVYRFESSSRTKFSDGTCSTNAGDTYYTSILAAPLRFQ